MRVCIPFRSDGGQRDRLFAHCINRWVEAGFAVTVGGSNDALFNRARSMNRAAAGDWDVAVFADGDIVIDPVQAERAALKAQKTGRLVYAHNFRYGLDEVATEAVLAGGDPGATEKDAPEKHAETFSSCLAISRKLWDEVGGYDERFEGWGFEDLCFKMACTTLGGPYERVGGPIYHLWHSRIGESEHPKYNESFNRYHRYLAANGDPVAMKELLQR